MTRPAVFLDRDGTINEEVGYVNHVDRFWLLPGVAEAIRLLNERGLPVVVATNQAGAARGYFPLDLIDRVHERMRALLAADGARVDALYACPHLPESVLPELALDCACRKPKTGMIERAAREHDLDLRRSYMVGDRWKDVEFGRKVGAKGILVLTGYGKGELEYGRGPAPDHVAPDLLAAVRWILEDLARPKTRGD
jgi:D-glycero-D-manno-heptose 1,7-bisphosphate phosphatase